MVPNFRMDCSAVHPGQHCVPVNIGADNFTVRVIGPDDMDGNYDEYGDRLWHGRIESYGDGTHALSYTPPFEGNYVLEVCNSGRPGPMARLACTHALSISVYRANPPDVLHRHRRR